MKVTETIKKEFTPYKISIKRKEDKFILEYWVRTDFVSISGRSEYVAHEEGFKTIDEAVRRFNEVIKEIR